MLQGLALAALGEHSKAEEAHLKSIEISRDFLDGWAHLVQVFIQFHCNTSIC